MTHVHTNPETPRAWPSLAHLKGPAEICTCSEMQLAYVGCDCPAEQNLPIACDNCGAFCRTEKDIAARICTPCRDHDTLHTEPGACH